MLHFAPRDSLYWLRIDRNFWAHKRYENFSRIFFVCIFLLVCRAALIFFTDVTIGIRSTFQILWTSLWSVQKIFQRPLKTTNKFQLKPRNCQNVVTPFLMAFLPHVFDECSQPPRIFFVDFTNMFKVSARSTSCSSLH